MEDQKLTGWYQSHEKPAYVGFYERDHSKAGDGSIILKSWYSGMCFGVPVSCNFSAVGNLPMQSKFQSLPWRGLAEDPNAGYITVKMPRPDADHIQRRDDNGEHSVSVFYKTEKKSSEAFELIREAMK